MLEAQLYTAAAEPKGSYALPTEYDGTVNETALYHAVRAFQNNQRQGTASTKTRAEVSGGSRKPWRQKGTGRARQGTIRAAQWTGGGVVFGPRPRSYRTDVPRKVRKLARQSALNARAGEGALLVVEHFEFESPKTKQMVELLSKMGLGGKKVLVLTSGVQANVHLSGRNLQDVYVMPYADASAYEVLWSDAVVVEESALGGQEIEGSKTKRTKRATSAKKKTAKKKATAKTATRKGGSDA
ncbi:MAG: 50S ribosomal protein L4 [Gemmatimonadales bacterium]|jgi:large subunit ribosomal protein L4